MGCGQRTSTFMCFCDSSSLSVATCWWHPVTLWAQWQLPSENILLEALQCPGTFVRMLVITLLQKSMLCNKYWNTNVHSKSWYLLAGVYCKPLFCLNPVGKLFFPIKNSRISSCPGQIQAWDAPWSSPLLDGSVDAGIPHKLCWYVMQIVCCCPSVNCK